MPVAQNMKQKGSNVGSLDYSNGMCPTSCEQCYVNFGRYALIVFDMSDERKRYAKRLGWKPHSPALIPRFPETEWQCAIDTVMCKDGNQWPLFMRSGTNVCSAYAPAAWTARIRDTWGERVFFNASIRTIARKEFHGRGRKGNLREWHKLIVTVNPGRQSAPEPAMNVSEDEELARRVKRILSCEADLGRHAPSDFDTPQSLTSVGMPEFEPAIKWYRMRVIPTIVPRFEPPKGQPVVLTVMRFKSWYYAVAWARKYGLGIEIDTSDERIMAESAMIGFQPNYKKKGRTILRLWSHDDWNTSAYRGEATEFSFDTNWYRCSRAQLDQEPWVCDRANQSCPGCGLCARLDAQYPGAIHPDAPVPPVPFSMGHIVDEHGRFVHGRRKAGIQAVANPYPQGDELFKDRLREIGLHNPTSTLEEKDLGWLSQSLAVLGAYYRGEANATADGWDTWETAEDLMAYCVWCLLRAELRRLGDPHAAYASAIGIANELSGLQTVGCDEDLRFLLENTGKYHEMFGSVWS